MLINVDLKTVIITGAGKGLGRSLTERFLKSEEWEVIGISRNVSALQKHPRLRAISFDLTQFHAYPHLMNEINTKGVHVLINNAGYLNKMNLGELDLDRSRKIWETNLMAPAFLIQALTPVMVKGSHIVNISSLGGISHTVKFPGMSIYSSSKAAVNALTECLATELGEKGISINALALGTVQTEMLSQAFPGFEAPVSANTMAEYVFDFATKGSTYFNGQIIPVALSIT